MLAGGVIADDTPPINAGWNRIYHLAIIPRMAAKESFKPQQPALYQSMMFNRIMSIAGACWVKAAFVRPQKRGECVFVYFYQKLHNFGGPFMHCFRPVFQRTI